MTRFKIARKSFQLITSNFSGVFRIFAVLYLVSYGLSAVVAYATTGVWSVDPLASIANLDTTRDIILFMLTLVVWTITGIWAAVAWHRHVLLEESPRGWVPHWPKEANIGYFFEGLIVSGMLLMFYICFLIIWALASELFAQLKMNLDGYIVPLAVATLGNFVFLRICLVFPAAALGRKLTTADSWRATAPYSSSLLFLAGILALVTLVTQEIAEYIDLYAVSQYVIALLDFLYILWMLSIMTTLYGTIVEDRDIEAF